MKTNYFVYNFGFFIALLMQVIPAVAEVSTSTDPETQQQQWLLTTPDGFKLKLAQLTPDQAHGFFLARGFPSRVASAIAAQCPMQTVITNTGTVKNGVAMTVFLKEWQVKTTINNQEKRQGIKLKQTWHKEWQKETDIPASAQLAFRWATFPNEQTFHPHGDYNWGITTIGLSASSESEHTFDLKVVWHQNGVEKSQWIDAMSCATNH